MVSDLPGTVSRRVKSITERERTTSSILSDGSEGPTIRAATSHGGPVCHAILPNTSLPRDQHVMSCYTNPPRARDHGRGCESGQELVCRHEQGTGRGRLGPYRYVWMEAPEK